ncbi:hypothetical protein PsorP6_006145 [Peronosclerospora sorghi]|uniref:Uncharacterized protein n=1 Tax=Peronosclerospora sorghi TaxID=230839 RepID=A0ACC0W3G3_9STRA|nr:hypothetical protein PsorP6_006145 [Peronosclerospora sorghi]
MASFKTLLLFTSFHIASMSYNVAGELLKGHDLSSVALMETKEGAKWISTSGENTTIETILGDGGMNTVRLRLWTAGDYDLEYTLALAQRFSKAGYKIFLVLHFSDTWADPSNQAIPSGWNSGSIVDLAAEVQKYVASTLKAFTDGGVKIEILSLGNEITNGFLFPVGKITNDFSAFAKLWHAARQGVTDAVSAGTARPQVMIHLHNGWKSETVTWFFKGLFAEGTVTTDDVDAFGFSFYPYYGTDATLDALTSSLTKLAETYGKPIYIAETDWPSQCSSVSVTLSESFPVSAEGQRQWVAAIIGVLESLPRHLGAGILYWEPAYLKVPGLGSACESALLFSVYWKTWPTTYATALPSVNMFV